MDLGVWSRRTLGDEKRRRSRTLLACSGSIGVGKGAWIPQGDLLGGDRTATIPSSLDDPSLGLHIVFVVARFPLNAAVRDLKTHLSAYLRRVKDGEQLIITDHGEPCALIQPFPPRNEEAQLRMLMGNPNISWNGKSMVLPEPVAIGGKTMAEMVLEDRG